MIAPASIGLIIPSSNRLTEPQFNAYAPPGVGIHGTPKPESIGYSESHGCIRMQVPDAEWVFEHVDVGTPVWIVD